MATVAIRKDEALFVDANTIFCRYSDHINHPRTRLIKDLFTTDVVDGEVYTAMFREIVVQESESDKSWKLFAAGTAKRIQVRQNLMNGIILNALAQGWSRKETCEQMLSNEGDKKTLQNMQDTIKFSPDTIKRVPNPTRAKMQNTEFLKKTVV